MSDDVLERLARQSASLESGERDEAEVRLIDAPLIGDLPDRAALPGQSSAEGTARFADRMGGALPGFYRVEQGLRIASIGIGTYRGKVDPATDAFYLSALRTAFKGGVNLIDTSIIYRGQQSERIVGTAIRELIEQGDGQRDELVVCTKGGYLVPEGGQLVSEAVNPATLEPGDVVDGVHSVAPAFLADQLSRSLRNLGLTTIDVYYLHNPEVQLRSVGIPEFRTRMRRAFECLEAAASRGAIRYYGAATWGGFIDGIISLSALAEVAREIAGAEHHFRFVQLPFSLGMQEAWSAGTGPEAGVLDVARERGITVIASASLLQGRFTGDLPPRLVKLLPGLATDAQRAIQFARSAPGIAAALVGMSSSRHVEENLAVASRPPLTRREFDRVRSAIH
ncbi:MAG TPA: aldo/keto reductase [Marisediminicola sp.]|nr:aldo/keto reductase [Marisediminicola sp.]